ARLEQPLQRLQLWLQDAPGRVLFCAESAGRREALKELLGRIQLRPQESDDWTAFINSDSDIALCVAPLDESICFTDGTHTINLITENQLFGQRIRQTRRRQKQKTDAELV